MLSPLFPFGGAGAPRRLVAESESGGPAAGELVVWEWCGKVIFNTRPWSEQSLSLFRSQFFNCNQEPEEPLEGYLLWLQELHARWRDHSVRNCCTTSSSFIGCWSSPSTRPVGRHESWCPQNQLHHLLTSGSGKSPC
ncbi:hypothetical protein AAFF_G00273230 [Aldrovandia affinis]|uniref:Uncharacterized protein n=1 Tax=Aldrovandia affinis TaxID=143900 RepID=A0AAD7STE8_9TELE|nr:hypothetical protein AAFF_G00273230 [Aldrovandia affinis]